MTLSNTPFSVTLPAMLIPAGKQLDDIEKAVGPSHVRRLILARTAGQSPRVKTEAQGEDENNGSATVAGSQQVASHRERYWRRYR